jgi:hypothetical protein
MMRKQECARPSCAPQRVPLAATVADMLAETAPCHLLAGRAIQRRIVGSIAGREQTTILSDKGVSQ